MLTGCYLRKTVTLSPDIHRRLKLYHTATAAQIGQIVDAAVSEYLSQPEAAEVIKAQAEADAARLAQVYGKDCAKAPAKTK